MAFRCNERGIDARRTFACAFVGGFLVSMREAELDQWRKFMPIPPPHGELVPMLLRPRAANFIRFGMPFRLESHGRKAVDLNGEGRIRVAH